MDGKYERLRERLLICSVCMDEYKDPRILPCYHSLCFECIANILQSSSVTGRFFCCPQCRRDICIPPGGIQELPINFYIMSLQDELSSKDYEGKCELCKGNGLPSEFRCVDCDTDICRFCIHSHRLAAHIEKPKILRIQRNPLTSYPTSSNLNCSVHDKERLELYCFSCSMPVCVICSCGRHKKHSFMPLSVKLHELRTVLKREMVKIDSDVKNLADANALVEVIKHELLALSNKSILALDKAASASCEAIKKKKSSLEREILQSEKMQLKELDIVQTQITKLLRGMHSGYHYLADLQDSDMCLEAFLSFQTFAAKLEKARKEFSSIRVAIQQNHFFPSEYTKTPEFRMGFLRNILYFGRLGSLRSSYLNLIISPKTLLITKEPYRLMQMPVPVLCKQMLLFLLAFVFFFFASWVFDETAVSPLICSYVKDAYVWAQATFYERIDASKELLQHFFVSEEPSTSQSQDI